MKGSPQSIAGIDVDARNYRAVVRAAHNCGQAAMFLTPLHGKANILNLLIANI